MLYEVITVFLDEAVFLEIEEHRLGDLGLLGRRGTAEMVEGDAEPIIDIAVDRVIMVAQFPGGLPLLLRARFGGGAVFVGAADVQGVVPAKAAESGINVGRKDLNA